MKKKHISWSPIYGYRSIPQTVCNTDPVPVSPRPPRDGELVGWSVKHGLAALSLEQLRAAFEDAQTLTIGKP